ncbi:MAG: alcohol dehydrogenase catalytic domain-containing protein [Blautia sp.]
MAVKMLMKGAILPGNSTVEIKDFEIPKPGYGQVLIKTKATTICGSDIRCIYREHTGKGPEGYIPGMVAGHEPCGQIVEEGEGLKRFKKGDRVIVYHISGCGVCNDCRREVITFPVKANSVRLMAGRETVAWLLTFWQTKKI